jgi:exo-beta-1,3-glucanase (GH17 family)
MQNMYNSVRNIANGKRIVISETGWPNIGTAFEAAEPSTENALRYFINAQKWSLQDDIEMMYFSSFDEEWKIDAEGDVGAFWGLWDKDGKPKYNK